MPLDIVTKDCMVSEVVYIIHYFDIKNVSCVLYSISYYSNKHLSVFSDK